MGPRRFGLGSPSPGLETLAGTTAPGGAHLEKKPGGARWVWQKSRKDRGADILDIIGAIWGTE